MPGLAPCNWNPEHTRLSEIACLQAGGAALPALGHGIERREIEGLATVHCPGELKLEGLRAFRDLAEEANLLVQFTFSLCGQPMQIGLRKLETCAVLPQGSEGILMISLIVEISHVIARRVDFIDGHGGFYMRPLVRRSRGIGQVV